MPAAISLFILLISRYSFVCRCRKVAAGAAHLYVLRWAHGNGCQWSESVCSAAAGSSHLHVLQGQKPRVAVNRDDMRPCLNEGSFPCAEMGNRQWLQSHSRTSCQPSGVAQPRVLILDSPLLFSSQFRQLAVLRWAIDNGASIPTLHTLTDPLLGSLSVLPI